MGKRDISIKTGIEIWDGLPGSGKSYSSVQELITVEGMRRIELMFNALLAAEGQYVVEVQFIELSRSLTRRLGIDWNLSGILQFDAAIANRNIDTNGSLRCPVCLASTVLRATPMMKITIQTRISQTMRTSGKREYVLGTS